MKKRVDLKVTKYITPEGKQTCALNFMTGDVCSFYCTQQFGTQEVCMFSEPNSSGFGSMLQRGVNSAGIEGEGFLIPHAYCPIARGTFDVKK
jgi:hypothetical protein